MDKLAEVIDIKLHSKVFVSPYRRTIRSACELLKNHPKKAQLCVVLDPAAMEHLGNKNAMLLHAEAMRKFCKQLSCEYGITIDCSFLDSFADPDLWFLDIVPEAQLRNKLKEIAKGVKTEYTKEEERPDYDIAVFEALKQYFLTEELGHIESLEDFLERAKAFKARVKSYAGENVATDEHILIVTHSRMINCFFETMKWNEEKNRYDWGTHTSTSDIFKREV